MTKIPKPPPIPNPPKPLFTEIGGGFDKWDVAIVIVPIALTSLPSLPLFCLSWQANHDPIRHSRRPEIISRISQHG
jgi:hypothetical protein